MVGFSRFGGHFTSIRSCRRFESIAAEGKWLGLSRRFFDFRLVVVSSVAPSRRTNPRSECFLPPCGPSRERVDHVEEVILHSRFPAEAGTEHSSFLSIVES